MMAVTYAPNVVEEAVLLAGRTAIAEDERVFRLERDRVNQIADADHRAKLAISVGGHIDRSVHMHLKKALRAVRAESSVHTAQVERRGPILPAIEPIGRSSATLERA